MNSLETASSLHVRSAVGPAVTCIAWHGWSLQAPSAWRPLRLEGDRRRGAVMIGDAEQALVQVKWLRPGQRHFKAQTWLKERIAGVAPHCSPDPDAPLPHGFVASTWLIGKPGRDGIRRSVWYGYSARDDLVVEFMVNDAVEERLRKKVWREVLPSLRVRKANEPTGWALFDVGFETPAGFDLDQKRLASGDVSLFFVAGRRESLLLRQVYPAQVALERRPMERWIAHFPFKEHRRFRHEGFENWGVTEPRPMEGMCRRGWRRLPSPLGRCAERVAVSVAVVDKNLDRLLLAEHASACDQGDAVVTRAVARMNWHRNIGD